MKNYKFRCHNCNYEGVNPHAKWLLILSLIGISALILEIVIISTGWWYKSDTDFALISTLLLIPALFAISIALVNKWSACPKCGFKNVVKID